MSHIHIPDGVLPLWLWVAGWAISLGLVAVVALRVPRDEARHKVPLLAVVSALMIVSMSSEIVPIAYHVNLAVVAGVLLGPSLAIVSAFIVQVVLAMLGHGGVTVLGLNTLMIAGEMVIGWLLFRALVGALGRPRVGVAAFLATVVTLAITTTALVGIVALSGAGATARETGALDPSSLRFENPFAEGVFSAGLFGGGHEDAHHDEEGAAEDDHEEGVGTLSVARFAAVVYLLGPFGWVLEGLLTALILGYVARVRPGLLWSGRLVHAGLRLPGDEGTVN